MRCSKSIPVRMRVIALVAGLAIVQSGPGAQAAAAQDGRPSHYAIENARIVPVSGKVIDQGTVVIDNGVITAVGQHVDVPAGAWTIDGTGLTVYPGLIDGMTSLGMEQVQSGQRAQRAQRGQRGDAPPGASGAPYSRGPEDRAATFTWVMAADQLVPDDDQLDKWRTAGFTTVVTMPSRGFFPGHAAVVNLGGDRPNDMVVKTPVALRFNLRGGPGHRGYPSSLAGAFAYINQLFMDAARYARAKQLYNADPRGRERPAYDRALESLMPVQSGEEPLLFPASSATEIRRAIRTSESIGVTPIIFGAHSGYERPPNLGRNTSWCW